MKNNKTILDACCSGRMFWFEKKNPNCLYCDIRQIPKGTIKNAPNFSIEPDKIMDFRNMDLPDKSFKLVVFDPPHLKSLDKNSWVSLKYGSLDSETWKSDILKGFNECWRVLDDYGTLIFKWSKSSDNRRRRDVSIENLLKILPIRPLFGHPSGSKLNTIWFCFMKIPKTCGDQSTDENTDLNVQWSPSTPAGVQGPGRIKELKRAIKWFEQELKQCYKEEAHISGGDQSTDLNVPGATSTPTGVEI